MKNALRSGIALGATMLGLAFPLVGQAASDNYADRPEAKALYETLEAEGFERDYLRSVLDDAKQQESILKAMSRPAEKRLTWGEYRNIFIQPKRIERGVKFWQEHADTLARAEAEYGVPAEVIVAIIGVETHYGRIMGNYRVLDALATLGFDYPRRSEFFLGQLEDYLRMTREESIEPGTLKGSYAGAMGYGQFIPSSFRHYAIDFDGDGHRNIWSNPVDAIGSVANYFAEHGWKSGEPVRANVVMGTPADPEWINAGLKPEVSLAQWRERDIRTHKGLDMDQPATLMRLEMEDGDHYWFGLHNFYVITRYNHSRLYGMAVYELSQAIAEARKKG
ncbi:lytic murein transglycosylase B [Marinobacterium mangrovicola]|uniref:Membrane-bound lytic murein transglycosylase B n=1 Tax=Marinobacterium mangrovicola TaxID=1476959 RepID=A0A4R1GG87_9GAMM|nr:lytic murein transglycosylase B [Marinobacterium mangrovicola]TCK05910.1 membrane-bound lytic murein transglycosylase B [Marinobacterium mangrovicola]